MICPRCLHRLATTASRTLRPLSTTARLLHPASAPDLSTQNSPRGPPSGTHEGPPAALSTSAAQPFSTPLTPAPSSIPGSGQASAAEAATAAAPRSSVAAGTVLKGLGYVKNQDAPIAKEDSEYPDWLWSLLSKKGGKSVGKEGEEEEDADLYSKSKKQRRLANKRAALLAASAPLGSANRKIPLEHQSIDLPAGDGTVAGAIGAAEAREEVRVAMRRGRRKGIKEGNYLKAMR